MTILNLFGLNPDPKLFAVAYADDLIIEIAGKNPPTLQSNLKNLVDKINAFYRTWNLRMNPDKCETIVFRCVSNHLSKKAMVDLKGEEVIISHKMTVKYLSVHIDHLLRLRGHPDIQLAKAKAAFKANGRIFHNKNLMKRAKIIYYLHLVRPILTYAAPIWWNTSAAIMGNFRVFERKCIRTCIRAYRSAESNFNKFICNKDIYNIAMIPRIDNHIIRLIRDYFSKLPQINNTAINNLTRFSEEDLNKYNETGLLPPQTFLPLDHKGLIRDGNNVPVIYHWKRHKARKKIEFSADDIKKRWFDFNYSRALSLADSLDAHGLSDKY